MSASLIGRLGSSTFRLSATSVSMSLTGALDHLVHAGTAANAARHQGVYCTTTDVMMVAYPDVAWTKGAYRNVRRALFEVAWPIGRAKDPPGRPLIWRALKIYRDRENQTARGGVMPLR